MLLLSQRVHSFTPTTPGGTFRLLRQFITPTGKLTFDDCLNLFLCRRTLFYFAYEHFERALLLRYQYPLANLASHSTSPAVHPSHPVGETIGIIIDECRSLPPPF